MKNKLMSLILGVLMLTMPVMAMAADFSVSPVISVATFEDADTTTGVGLKAEASNLGYVIPSEVVLGSGVNFYDLGTSDLYRVPATVGYNFAVKDNLTITPNIGLVVDILDIDANDAESSVGFTTGANVALKATENLSLVVGVAYVANTVEDANLNLDGYTFSGGASYKF